MSGSRTLEASLEYTCSIFSNHYFPPLYSASAHFIKALISHLLWYIVIIITLYLLYPERTCQLLVLDLLHGSQGVVEAGDGGVAGVLPAC